MVSWLYSIKKIRTLSTWIYAVLEESRRNRFMLKYFNTTNIAIIRKVKKPKTCADL